MQGMREIRELPPPATGAPNCPPPHEISACLPGEMPLTTLAAAAGERLDSCPSLVASMAASAHGLRLDDETRESPHELVTIR